MKHTKLSDHSFEKGVFITPLNSLQMMTELEDGKSWIYGRMPEYLWIGLVMKYYGHDEGLKKSCQIISKLHKLAPALYTARMSQILRLEPDVQRQFYTYILSICTKEMLAPLTVFLTSSRAPIFAEYFCCPDHSIEDRSKELMATMHGVTDQHSEEASDIRFIALYFNFISGKLHLQRKQVDLLHVYLTANHDDELMNMARRTVCSIEMMILTFEKVDSTYLIEFWRSISEMTDCNMFAIKFPKENRNITAYMEKLYDVFEYLTELFKSTDPLNEKMNVLLGIATYSYNRLKEIYEYQLFNSISGRSCVRVLIEDYIMMKYLVKSEASNESIWREYQLYGMGLYKLVLARYREYGVPGEHHFDEKYIEALVNEFKNEEIINMDTTYFNKHNVRLKAEAIGEKNLYGLYYDYDSSFEHGLWGAIRESSLLKCDNPAHNYHCIPDINGETRLKTVLPDCIMIMNKTVSFLDEIYGIPKSLLDEVVNFEIKPIIE